jgi:hypothetical protein
MVVGARLDDPQRPTGGDGSVWPVWPELIKAPFSVFSLPTESVECKELTKGVFYQRGAPEQDVRAARFKPQPSATMEERSKGRLTTRLGQMGVA